MPALEAVKAAAPLKLNDLFNSKGVITMSEAKKGLYAPIHFRNLILP
jgi:hypothetical protein